MKSYEEPKCSKLTSNIKMILHKLKNMCFRKILNVVFQVTFVQGQLWQLALCS